MVVVCMRPRANEQTGTLLGGGWLHECTHCAAGSGRTEPEPASRCNKREFTKRVIKAFQRSQMWPVGSFSHSSAVKTHTGAFE